MTTQTDSTKVKTDADSLVDVARFDIGEINGKASYTPEGYIKADALVTRTGVFTYRNPDGSIRRELRHPVDVFKVDSLDTLRMVPVTNEHPKTRLVTADTAKEIQVGYTGENIRPVETYVQAPLVVTVKDAIDDIKNGKKELSCGYVCDLVKESGEYNGEHYDHRQTNIRYNHVAICRTGRAGAEIRINLDSTDAEMVIENQPTHSRSGRMKKIVLDGIEYEAAPEVLNRLDAAEKALTEEKAARDTDKAKLDSLTAELEQVKTDAKVAAEAVPGKITDAVKARLTLVHAAEKHLDAETVAKLDSLSDGEIRSAVVLKAFPSAAPQLKDASEQYVIARFDSAVEVLSASGDKMADQRRVVNDSKKCDKCGKDSKNCDCGGRMTKDNCNSGDARKKMMARAGESWKK